MTDFREKGSGEKGSGEKGSGEKGSGEEGSGECYRLGAERRGARGGQADR